MPWPDYLTPLAEGLTAIERAVYECALARCDSIWVVCNDDTAPLVKKRIGDYVLDPEIFSRINFLFNPKDHQKHIPVFYVPVSQKDRGRRDSLGWSVLQGALNAFIVSQRISKWVVPSKYFVCFPYGLYDPNVIKGKHSIISSQDSFYMGYKNKTVRDGLYLPFTFNPEDWIKFKNLVKNQCTGGNKKIPIHERWSSKNFKLDKIFNCDNIEVCNIEEVEEYYSLDSWDSLKRYYQSDLSLRQPSKKIIKPFYK